MTAKALIALFLLVLLCATACAAPPVDTKSPAPAEMQAFEAAVRDLSRTFGHDYPGAKAFLQRLDQIRESGDKANFESLRREALLANPLVSRHPILFVVRQQYRNEHGTEATMYQTGEINTSCFRGGGALKRLHLPSGKVEALLAARRRGTR